MIDGTYSKCITIPIISDALDWFCGDECKFYHAHEGYLLMPNKQTRKKVQQESLFKGKFDTYICLEAFRIWHTIVISLEHGC